MLDVGGRMQVSVAHHDAIALLHPDNDDARLLLEWCAPDAAIWLGEALVVEHRLLQGVLDRLSEQQPA